MSNLHIHSITLYNFKSFKGLNIIQPLDPFLNVIAGSNGSGKSNIIDSILFVLGFSAKSLRHKIITDVIYQNETQLDSCYVEITFRHTEDIIIRREIKNKKNIYMINNKVVNVAEISALLKEKNIDNKRFLILQGEVESISMMKPKSGMLAYLEEIIGTDHYEKEIAVLCEDYERMNALYDSKTTNYKFNEKEFNMLKDDNDEDIKNLKMYVDRLKAEVEVDDYKRQFCVLKNTEMAADLKKTEKALGDLEAKNMVCKRELCKEEAKLASKKMELVRIEGELKKKKKSYYEIDTQNALYENRKGKLEKNIEKLNKEIENKNIENKQKNIEKEMIEKELGENIINIKEMTKELNSRKKEIEKGEKEKTKLPKFKQSKILEKEFLATNEEKIKIENRILDYEENLKTLEVLKNQKDSAKGNKEKKERHEKIQIKVGTLRENLQLIDGKLRDLQTEKQKENYKLNEFTKNENTNKNNLKLHSLFKSIDGFVGRLGDLGSAKEELDVAISTAGKGVLNYIVVENTETAEKCIDLLKKNNIERTSFMICDKISSYKPKNDFDYLINHIDCDEKYKKLFYFALSDTILCKNIEEATRIAMGNVPRKAVTLDGNMIDKSGLMSGGGALSGAMRVQNNKRNAVEHRIETLDNEIKILTEEKEDFIKVLNDLTEQLAELGGSIKPLDIKSIEEKIKNTEAEIKAVKIKELASGLDKINKKIDKLKKELSEIESFLNGLDSIQVKATKGEIGILFEKIALNENRNVDLKLKISNLRLTDMKQYEKLLSDYTEEIKQLKQPLDYDKCKKELKAFESQRDKILESVNEVALAIKEIKSKIGTDFDIEIEHKNHIDELNEQLTKNKTSIEKIDKARQFAMEEVKLYGNVVECKPIEKAATIDDEDILRETIKRMERKYTDISKANNGQFNLKSINDFIVKSKEFNLFRKDYDSFVKELSQKKANIDAITRKRANEFTEGLKAINKHLKEIYQLITFGGNAELEFVDTLDPFSEGIILSVMPPKKSWRNVNMLSGGEKTISSLALVFALHAYRPSCFYIMDEIDAALDNRNVNIIANYIYERAKNAQFLIVSLRNNMFELSDTLVGVFKNDGASKTLLFDTKSIQRVC